MSAIHNEPAAKSKYRRTLSEHKVMHWVLLGKAQQPSTDHYSCDLQHRDGEDMCLLVCLLAQADPAAELLSMGLLLQGAGWHPTDALSDHSGDATLCGAYRSQNHSSFAATSFHRPVG